MLANWSIRRDLPWDERLADLGRRPTAPRCVVQREVLDPAAYVELWLKDAGLHGGPDYLQTGTTPGSAGSTSRASRASASGGSTSTRDGYGPDDSDRVTLDWPYAVEQPIAPAIRDWALAAARPVG